MQFILEVCTFYMCHEIAQVGPLVMCFHQILRLVQMIFLLIENIKIIQKYLHEIIQVLVECLVTTFWKVVDALNNSKKLHHKHMFHVLR
jgi:hypothetical protein